MSIADIFFVLLLITRHADSTAGLHYITTWICAKGYPTRAQITAWDQLAALEVHKIEIL